MYQYKIVGNYIIIRKHYYETLYQKNISKPKHLYAFYCIYRIFTDDTNT